MESLKYLSYKSENIEAKHLNNTQRNRFLKLKSVFLELQNDFLGLKDAELKYQKEKAQVFSRQLLCL